MGALLQFGGQLHPLGLAAGQGGRRLTQPDIPETDLDQRLEVPVDRTDGLEEFGRLLDRCVQHLGDVLALVVDLERLAVEPGALAHLAGHVDVREEVHLDLQVPSPAQASPDHP